MRFFRVILALQIIAFAAASILSVFFGSPYSFTIAHITGGITILTLLTALIYAIMSKYYLIADKNAIISFIIFIISSVLMIFGYLLFYAESISPMAHALASINFDVATSGYALNTIFLIKIITK